MPSGVAVCEGSLAGTSPLQQLARVWSAYLAASASAKSVTKCLSAVETATSALREWSCASDTLASAIRAAVVNAMVCASACQCLRILEVDQGKHARRGGRGEDVPVDGSEVRTVHTALDFAAAAVSAASASRSYLVRAASIASDLMCREASLLGAPAAGAASTHNRISEEPAAWSIPSSYSTLVAAAVPGGSWALLRYQHAAYLASAKYWQSLGHTARARQCIVKACSMLNAAGLTAGWSITCSAQDDGTPAEVQRGLPTGTAPRCQTFPNAFEWTCACAVSVDPTCLWEDMRSLCTVASGARAGVAGALSDWMTSLASGQLHDRRGVDSVAPVAGAARAEWGMWTASILCAAFAQHEQAICNYRTAALDGAACKDDASRAAQALHTLLPLVVSSAVHEVQESTDKQTAQFSIAACLLSWRLRCDSVAAMLATCATLPSTPDALTLLTLCKDCLTSVSTPSSTALRTTSLVHGLCAWQPAVWVRAYLCAPVQTLHNISVAMERGIARTAELHRPTLLAYSTAALRTMLCWSMELGNVPLSRDLLRHCAFLAAAGTATALTAASWTAFSAPAALLASVGIATAHRHAVGVLQRTSNQLARDSETEAVQDGGTLTKATAPLRVAVERKAMYAAHPACTAATAAASIVHALTQAAVRVMKLDFSLTALVLYTPLHVLLSIRTDGARSFVASGSGACAATAPRTACYALACAGAPEAVLQAVRA
ncbi:MAG: hypothetical protein EOO41_01775, partial [Methanobacteriota archaeon]